MGLPERDYYLRTDEESAALRKAYEEHIGHMFGLLGEPAAAAARDAATVLALETELAKQSFGAVDFRDPQHLLNKISVAEAQGLTPHFDWTAYLRIQGLDPALAINVIAPVKCAKGGVSASARTIFTCIWSTLARM